MFNRIWVIFFVIGLASLSSCRFYRQDILFRTDGLPDSTLLKRTVAAAEGNYRFQVNDWVSLQVYTNKGEQIVDPNFMYTRQLFSTGGNMMMQNQMTGAMNLGVGPTTNFGRYLIDAGGIGVLPLIGPVRLQGLTYRQADSLLSKRYNEFYEDAFVVVRAANRRVIIFNGGSAGLGTQVGAGAGQATTTARVFNLENESMTLIEVLAAAGGLPVYAKAYNIRVIRGDLRNPQVKVFNLQYINTMTREDLRIYPNDIIYVEPGRRPALDLIRDIGNVVSLPISVLSLVLVLSRL